METNKQWDKEIFSKRLKEARSLMKLTQQELAKMAGVSSMMISAYENPDSTNGKNPAISNIIALSNVLGVSIDWLCGISDTKEPNRSGNINTKDFLYTITALIDNTEKQEVVGVSDWGTFTYWTNYVFSTNGVNTPFEDFVNEYEAVKKISLPDSTYAMVVNTVIEKYSKLSIKGLFEGDVQIFNPDETPDLLY